LFLAGIVLTGHVHAQDLEPRRWSNLPIGTNLVGVGYAHTDANVYFNPALAITDATAKINALALTAIHTFDLAGKSARVSALLPYTSGSWQGLIGGEDRTINREGVGDPRIRFSVNLYGAPAMKRAEFAQYYSDHRTNTVVGASIAATIPLGKYCNTCLINIGHNRWSVRPQLGVVHTRGPWSFELTGSAFVFTDNSDFVDKAVLKQTPLYALQTHVIYNFKPGLWASISSGYGFGGEVSIDRKKTLFEVDNWLLAASLSAPIGKRQSIKLTWLSGRTQNQVGRDSDNILLSWSMRFFD
jgi:hypothetical protein